MADRRLTIEVDFDADGAVTGMRRIDSTTRKASRSIDQMQRRTTAARSVVVRGFAQMSKAARLFTGTLGAVRRTLFTLRFLVLGFFVQQFVNRIVKPLIDASADLDRVMFRLGAAVNAAQKRFGQAAGTTKEWFSQIANLRKESNQFSTRELAEVVAGVAELSRNFGIAAADGELLTRRILDIAAATGRTLTDVITRLRSGFLGSTEAIEDLGINFKITRLQQEALMRGMRGQFQLLKDTEQAQVRLNVVMKDTVELEGVLERVLATVSGRMRAMNAAWSDFILLLSQAFINTQFFRTLFEGISSLIQFLTGNLKELSTAGKLVLLIVNNLLATVGVLFNLLIKGPEIIANLVKGNLSLAEAFKALRVVFLEGFKMLQLDLGKFAEDAASVFSDKFSKRVVDLISAPEALKNIQGAMKALTSQFGGTRTEGLLSRFILPSDLRQFQLDTGRVGVAISDLRERVEADLARVRNSIISFGLDVRDVDPAEVANQFSKLAQALGETLDQRNQLVAFQQAMADFNLIIGLTEGTIETSTITFNELTAALSRLGIAFEDLEIKSGGPIKRFKSDIKDIINIAGVMTALVAGSFQSLGTLIADALTGTDEPLKKFGAAILSIIGDLAIQLGTLFIAWGFAVLAWQKSFANPFAAIAAGVALVTIGGAIKGFAASFAGGAAAGTGATTTTVPEANEFTVPLSSISPRQGIAEDDRLTSTLERMNQNLSRIEGQEGVLIVKDGVRKLGGVTGLLTRDDRQQLTQTVLGQSTLNSF